MAGRAALSLVLLYSLAFLSAAQQRNVALWKHANASAFRDYSSFPPSQVTDDTTRWDNAFNNGFHSNEGASPNWLRVYLEAVYPMTNIVIYYRKNYDARFVGTQINIRNDTNGPAQLCVTVTNSNLDTNLAKGSFSCSMSGSIVELRIDGGTLNICEVQVWVGPECAATTYGSTCTPCGHCLNGAVCDKTHGACLGGCDPGWTGIKCDAECRNGTHGAGCTLTCGNCAGNANCDKKTGACAACQEGFALPLCTGSDATGRLPENASSSPGLGAGIGIGLGVACLVFVPALLVTVVYFKRRLARSQDHGRGRQQASQGDAGNAERSVYYNVVQEEPERGENSSYSTLETATRIENVPRDYEEIRNNRNVM